MQIRFCSDEWNVLRERPRRKTMFQFWATFGWQVTLQDLKKEPHSIPSDKKLKPAQHISDLLFPVEVSQYCPAKLMAWKESGGGKGILNYSILLNPDLSLNAIPFSYPVASWIKEGDRKKWRNRLKICSPMIWYNEHWASRINTSNREIATLFSLAFAILELLQCKMKKVILIVKITITSFLEWGRTAENIVPHL